MVGAPKAKGEMWLEVQGVGAMSQKGLGEPHEDVFLSELGGTDQESGYKRWGSVPSGKTNTKKTSAWMKLDL